MTHTDEIIFEESLSDDWNRDREVIEVSLDDRPMVSVWIALVALGVLVAGQVVFLGVWRSGQYRVRALANMSQSLAVPAPRGLIYDRFGETLAENRVVFSAFLDLKEFLRVEESQAATLRLAEDVLGIEEKEVLSSIRSLDLEQSISPLLLKSNLSQSELVKLKGANLPTLLVENIFGRDYPDGEVFSSVVGYVGRVSPEDLERNPGLNYSDLTGKAGIEYFYDQELRGEAGEVTKLRDAKGIILGEEGRRDPKIGASFALTIDGKFQKFFYDRMRAGLNALNRTSGVGIAIDPRNGEVLALLSLPSYDSNAFSGNATTEERREILESPDKPLFNRVSSGLYPPGSTIKPLVGIAALKEGVVAPEHTVFSPGYLDIPNPYDPDHPTRYLDWRYQGEVDLSAAIAQSSNVYFYTVGGGTGTFQGLGINRLREWWGKFGFGKPTQIDLPGEESGFLPSPAWRDETTGRTWLLGDTYNVAIGQGDFLVTPIQLLNYIAGIAGGGKIYKPVLRKDVPHPEVIADLSYLESEMAEIKKGMAEAVTSPLGTARLLSDLPMSIGAKTGSAQVRNNEEVNAFFVGYMPSGASAKEGAPQIAILVMVENAPQGSLSAVPIAKEVLWWYYWNRIHK